MTAAPYLAIITGLCILAAIAAVSWLHERGRRIHAEALLAQAMDELADGWDDDHGSADEWLRPGMLGWRAMSDEWRRVTGRHHAEQEADA